jgi:exo-beta-1,3-glucanase (GH17 family)
VALVSQALDPAYIQSILTHPLANSVNWLGHNSFPYFETTRPNAIDQAFENFYAGVGQTESVSGGKEVWITETGWPRSKLYPLTPYTHAHKLMHMF